MRGVWVLLAGLAGLAAAEVAAGEPPPAERPDYALGEEWFRSDGVYELIRIENDRYIFTAGPEREVHLTRDLAVAKMQRGNAVMEFDPPPTFTWPLQVGKGGTRAGTWRTPRIPAGVRASFTWSVEAYEDVQVPAGAFKAFRIKLSVGWGQWRKGAREVHYRFWYAPEARQLVKAVGEQGALLDFELAHVDRSGAAADGPAGPPRSGPGPGGGKRYGLGFLDALAAVERGEGREALRYYEALAERRERTGPPLEAAKAHAGVAYVAGRVGLYQKGIRSGLRALELFRAAPPSPDVLGRQLSLHSHVAMSYAGAGELKEARRFSEEGLALARTATNPQQVAFYSGVFHSGLALVSNREGDYRGGIRDGEEAVPFLERYLANLPAGSRFDRARGNAGRLLALTFARVAAARRRQGELDEAEAAARRGVAAGKAAGHAEAEAAARLELGWVALARKDHAGSLRLFQEAEAQASRANLASYLMWALAGLGATHAGLGQHAEALAAYARAVAAVEDLRSHLQEVGLRSGFLEDKQGIYHGAVGSALRVGRPDEAFGYAERARARAFLDLLGGQTVLSKGRTRALVAEETRLRADLAEAQALAQDAGDEEATVDPAQGRGRLEAAMRAYRAFLEGVRRENLEQASLMTVEPVTLEEVRGLLPGGVTLLEFLVTASETILWVVDAQRTEVLRIPIARRDLVAEVRAFRRAIEDQAPLPEVQAKARRLYDRLLGVARPHLRSDRLLIVPHDVLHYLPFGALRSPDRWLIEDYTLATLPSASVLKYLGGKGAGAGGQVLALGNPDLGPALNLRFAEREARAVGARYPGATVLVGAQATEPKVKALSGSAGLLHFATHGELNENDPLSSALLLVPEGQDDGRLEVRKIFGLDLQARLVVLSACETGLGKLSRGDELVGLQRAFLYAGTPAVVTTLWKVDDRASFRLMESFYDHLPAAGPAAALRQAQRATMAAFPHPFAWAGFGLTGVPR